MKPVTQTSQFAALKTVLFFMEQEEIQSDETFPEISYNILKKYVEDQEREALKKEERNELQQALHASNVPAGHTGE